MKRIKLIWQWIRGLIAPAIATKHNGRKFVIQAIGANNKKGEKRTFYMLPYIVPRLRRNVTQLANKILKETPPEAIIRFKAMTFLNRDIFALIASNIQWLVSQDYLSQFVACILLPEGVSIEQHNTDHIADTARWVDLYMPQDMQIEAVVLFFVLLDIQTMLAVWSFIQQTLSQMKEMNGQEKK